MRMRHRRRRIEDQAQVPEPAPPQLWTVAKRFTFDAAHRLPLHDGKCKDLHGHTYIVEVTATGTLINTGAKSGMVVDFGDMKQVWDEHIKPVVDHQFLNDTLPIEHTTAELIAGWILEQFQFHLAPLALTVQVGETPDSWARTWS